MIAQSDLLAHYQSVASATSAMLSAARKRRWDELVAAERQCAERIARIKALTDVPELDEPSRRAKFDILRTMLANDAEICKLTQPWLEKVEVFLGGRARDRNTSDAYR